MGGLQPEIKEFNFFELISRASVSCCSGNSCSRTVDFKKDLQDKLFEQNIREDLTKVGGLEIVVNWLKKDLGEDNLYKCVRVWSEFEACKQKKQ